MSGHGAGSADVVVVGGGVAGLSVAAALAGHARVLLLEQEAELARHASGDNAAIFRPLEHDATSATLAMRSLELLQSFGAASVLRRSGLLLVSDDAARTSALAAHAGIQGVQCMSFDQKELTKLEPTLAGGEARHGLFLAEGGVFDVQALNAALAHAAAQRGAEIRKGVRVARVLLDREVVRGVELQDGTRIASAHVVLAAGAWGARLGSTIGAPLPLTSLRRHLVSLRLDTPPSASRPVVWRLEDEVYFRPDSRGILASPCDEAVRGPEQCETDTALADVLRDKLARLAPRLLETASVERIWACLRTFTPDREIVAGADPRVAGLAWLAALGGRGMSIAPAAGELVAVDVLGRARPALLDQVAVSRLL